MQYTFPNYYKEFSCIAGACPDTCCAGWQIVIDDQTLKKYQHFKGPFRNRLHNDIDWKRVSRWLPDDMHNLLWKWLRTGMRKYMSVRLWNYVFTDLSTELQQRMYI